MDIGGRKDKNNDKEDKKKVTNIIFLYFHYTFISTFENNLPK